MTTINEEFFPFTLPCTDQGSGSYEFRPYFMKARPENLIWYGYDTVINSPVDVEFIVYDMRDNVYGGLGKKIATLNAVVPDTVTSGPINERARYLARSRRAQELAQTEALIVSRYADEILAEMSRSIIEKVSK